MGGMHVYVWRVHVMHVRVCARVCMCVRMRACVHAGSCLCMCVSAGPY